MTTAHNHDKKTKRKDARTFVEDLKKTYSDNGYIFRGTTTIHSNEINEIEAGKAIPDGINSTLYRWVVRKDQKEKGAFKTKEHKILREIFSKNKHFSPAIMEEEISINARDMSQSKAGKHEILTDLQHFGGKTNKIDFSHSIYVALFFACQGKFDKCGELIILHRDKFPLKDKGVEIIDPADTDGSRRRANAQKSVFVHPANGYIDPELCDIETIAKDLKAPIMEYLRKKEGIEPNTVYNDLHGFIKNQKNNETTSLYFYMGMSCKKEGDLKKSAMYYGKCIQKTPYEPSAYNNRGNVYDGLKKYKLAIQDLNMAILLKPDFAKAYNNRGCVYRNMKQYKLAVKDFDAAVLYKRDYAPAYSNRGGAYNDWGKYKLAIKDYGKAISLNPNFAKTYFNRGNVYKNLRQYVRAIQDFDKAISLDPQFVLAYLNRGNVYSYSGKNKRAIQDFDSAIDLNPKFVLAYNARGNAYKNLGQYARAIQDFDKAISLDPKFAEVYSNRGIAYGKNGQHKRAIQDFNKAISLKSNFAVGYNNRGHAYNNLGQHTRAIRDINKAISLNPNFPLAYNNRGYAYAHMKKYALAIENFSKSISLDPKNPQAYFNRGLVKRETGDKKGARADFAKAQKLGIVLPEGLLPPKK